MVIKRWYKFFGVVLALMVLVVVGCVLGPVMYTLYWPPTLPPAGQVVEIKIKFGTTPDSIAHLLAQNKVVRSAEGFMRALKYLRKTTALRAGRYSMPYPISNARAIKILTEGRQVYSKITIPEGYTAKRIARLMQQQMQIDSTLFMQYVHDKDFIQKLGIDAPSLEGYLLPETYFFTYGMNEAQIIQHLVGQFKRSVWDSLCQRARQMGFTPHQLVTLASIIEAEAILDDELPIISSVYHNRLKLGMPLQADPTIQYIIPDGPRRLLNRDLQIPSPYNTYLHRGLPPGPINNPGVKAIHAAMHPEATEYLYFVANGTGGHSFSATLRDHLRAKTVLDAERRRVARMKRGGGHDKK